MGKTHKRKQCWELKEENRVYAYNCVQFDHIVNNKESTNKHVKTIKAAFPLRKRLLKSHLRGEIFYLRKLNQKLFLH